MDLIFSHDSGWDLDVSDRILKGYTYEGNQVELWMQRTDREDGTEEYLASIRETITRNWDELATSGPKKSLHSALTWARKYLDGNPTRFGEFDFLKKKAISSIKGEGAELFVAGHMMMEYGLIANMASPNMPGYDILIVNPQSNKTCRLQVKYRSNSKSSIETNSLDFDFLVVVDKPSYDQIEITVSEQKALRRIPDFPVWVIDREWAKDELECLGRIRNPRYQEYYKNWLSIVDFVS